MALFLTSSDPDPGLPVMPFPHYDKVIHAVAFGGLNVFVAQGMRHSGKLYSNWTLALVPVLFTTLYGISDEIHQYYVPNRTFDVLDMAADSTGAIIAQAFLMLVAWRGVPMRRLFMRRA